jgi:hypothetical protein
VVVRAKNGEYTVVAAAADETFALLKKNGDWKPILDKFDSSPTDVWLQDTPPKLGDKRDTFLDPDESRQDDWYCWAVTSAGQIRMLNVDGIPPRRSRPYYTLPQYMCTNATEPTLVPGIGTAKLDFTHHGSVTEQHMTLFEFGRTKQTASSRPHANPSRPKKAKKSADAQSKQTK